MNYRKLTVILLALWFLLISGVGCQGPDIGGRSGVDYDGPIHSGYAVLVSAKVIVRTQAGTTFDYPVPVRNTGTLPDTYTVEITSASSWVDFRQITHEITLESGQEHVFPVHVVIPQTAQAGAEEVITIVARSHEVINLQDSAELRIQIEPVE